MDYLLLLILLKESITLTNIRFFIIFSSLFILLLKPVFATTATSNTGSTVTEQSESAVTSSKTSPKRDDASFEKENPNQQYIYEVEYKGISIGEMKQEYRWKGKNVALNSVADFSFLLFSFGGSQQSDVYWNELQQLFLSRSFFRESIGFSTVDMTAKFDETGHHSQIVNNGEQSEYTNEDGPIVDFNTINLQISEGLKLGKTDFEFYMQTSDDIAHYFFEVKGKEMIKTKFGEMEAYRVQQVRKKDRTFIAWFAPRFDHQMVKFEYERRVLDIDGELIKYSTDF